MILHLGLASLRSIINALATSVVPVLNAIAIFLITTAIYSLVAFDLFAESHPELFGKFSTSVRESRPVLGSHTNLSRYHRVKFDDLYGILWI